jgi:hypothetical protein
MRMILRLLLSMILICSLAACDTTAKKKKEAEAKAKADEQDLEDMGGDPDFLSFLGRLRKAVAEHDADTLAPMMTQNFGYCLNPPAEGAGVYQYWDQTNAWPQLQAVLSQHFLPKGDFMVAPPAFAYDPLKFHGYRAGLTMVNGSWRFAYFVTD